MIEYLASFYNFCHFIGLNVAVVAFIYAVMWGFTTGYNVNETDGITIAIDGVIVEMNLNRYQLGIVMGTVAGVIATVFGYLVGFGWFILIPVISYGFYVGDIKYSSSSDKQCSDTEDSDEFESANEN